MPAPRRAEILFRAAQLLAERKETLARDMTREMGKVLDETRGDVQEAIDMTYFMAGEGRRQYGQTVPSELRDKFAMSVRQPLGVCAVITPWNFPMAIPSWKIIPALVCGNTVVFKPATLTPLSARELRQNSRGSRRPARRRQSRDRRRRRRRRRRWSSSDDVRVVSFTGSTEVGRTVSERAAPSFKKVHLEMGGKNVIMVMDDANLDLAVEGCVWGGFGTTGQRCTAASRVVVHEQGVRAFLEQFSWRATKALRVGDGLDPDDRDGAVGQRGSAEDRDAVRRRSAERKARTLACGGHRADGRRPCQRLFPRADDLRRRRSVDAHRAGGDLRPGGVGDSVPVVRARRSRSRNGVQYGLSASIYTQDINRAFAAMRDLYTGIFYVNAPTIGAEVHLPFGGTKATGNGHREAGTAALDVFSEWKSVYVDFSGRAAAGTDRQRNYDHPDRADIAASFPVTESALTLPLKR